MYVDLAVAVAVVDAPWRQQLAPSMSKKDAERMAMTMLVTVLETTMLISSKRMLEVEVEAVETVHQPTMHVESPNVIPTVISH